MYATRWLLMRRELVLAALTLGMTGCAGEFAALLALSSTMTFAAWLVGRDRQRRALYEAESLKLAISSGKHRGLEERLRRELALVAAGEAVSLEREWLARAQLGGLLVAEWRLDEAAEVYGRDDGRPMSPHLKALAAFGRHELALLTETATEARLNEIRSDRDECLEHVPAVFRKDVEKAWNAIEGLCLVRMGHAREGAPMLAAGLRALEYNPALVVYLFHLGQAYEHIGERTLAATHYESASKAFPGTRLASEAGSRIKALASGQGEGLFRHMLPEAPIATAQHALRCAVHTEQDDKDPEEA